MRWPCVYLSFVVAVGLTACGASHEGANSDSRVSLHSSTMSHKPSAPTALTPARKTVEHGYVREDGDPDGDDIPGHTASEGDNPSYFATAGPRADRASRKAITRLVKRYYAAAADGDAVTACSLLAKSLAEELPPGTTGRAVGECPRAMAKTLSQERQQLREEDPATMIVLDVRVKGDLGLAILGFKAWPLGSILLEREGRAWKVDALLDSHVS
jgi:hypothetical protein